MTRLFKKTFSRAVKNIPIEEIINLRESGMNAVQIAEHFCCSARNINSRIQSRTINLRIDMTAIGFNRLKSEADARGVTTEHLVTSLLSAACFGGAKRTPIISNILDDQP